MINYTMNTIDNGDINFENIVEKMELMKILILELQTDLRLYHRERKNRDQRRDHENQDEVEQLSK